MSRLGIGEGEGEGEGDPGGVPLGPGRDGPADPRSAASGCTCGSGGTSAGLLLALLAALRRRH